MSLKLTNKENTLNWYKEYTSTKDLDRLSTTLIEEDLGKIKNRSVLFFADCDGVPAVVLSYKRGGSCVVVPVSEYSYPSSEFEVYLPKSNLVLQTWNARVCVPSKLKEVGILGKISESDMYIALSHYNAVFENADFNFPTLIGEALAKIKEELALCLDKYLYKQAVSLSESKFIVMPQDLSLQLEEFEGEFEEEEPENPTLKPSVIKNIINIFNPYGVAATPPEDEKDDDDTEPKNK